MTIQKTKKSIINDALIKEINDKLETIEYGTITIKVHDAKITQIEISQKKRFDDVWSLEGGAGI